MPIRSRHGPFTERQENPEPVKERERERGGEREGERERKQHIPVDGEEERIQRDSKEQCQSHTDTDRCRLTFCRGRGACTLLGRGKNERAKSFEKGVQVAAKIRGLLRKALATACRKDTVHVYVGS